MTEWRGLIVSTITRQLTSGALAAGMLTAGSAASLTPEAPTRQRRASPAKQSWITVHGPAEHGARPREPRSSDRVQERTDLSDPISATPEGRPGSDLPPIQELGRRTGAPRAQR